jgi:pilus assembly protein CpaB
MRIVFGLVLALGIGLAGFAVYMAQSYIGQTQAALAAERAARVPPVETVDVFIAKKQLRYGQRLSPDDVTTIAWPKRALPAGVFTDRAALFPENSDGPRTVLRAMEPNEPLMAVKLTAPGEDAGITSQLTRGMRAFTIQVNVTTGVAGFLRPTDRVDIYWTGRTGSGEITRLIDTAVRVIAVDQSADQDRGARTQIARNVTVEATPEQAASLAQAQATGRLSLSLVGVEDDTVSEAVQIDQRRLLGIEVRERVEVERPQICTIRTRRGNDVVEIPIPCTN